jgi:hypothetical protein
MMKEHQVAISTTTTRCLESVNIEAARESLAEEDSADD